MRKATVFFNHFTVNQQLLELYRRLRSEGTIVHMFTTDIIQERKEVKREIAGAFDEVVSTANLADAGIGTREDLGAIKRDPCSFEELFRRLKERMPDLQASHILVINDTVGNIEAAREAGLQGFQYNDEISFEEANAELLTLLH